MIICYHVNFNGILILAAIRLKIGRIRLNIGG